jgi:hypothetical protein
MKPADNIEEVIKKDLNFTAGTELHDRMLDDVLNAQEKSKKTKSALALPNIRRIIMKSSITKLAVAAAVIAVVVLGLVEFIGTGSTSGVVWAEVARKVEASQGLIYRIRGTNSVSLESEDGPDYSMHYLSAAHSRTDGYKNGQIIRSFYRDFEARTGAAVFHTVKRFIREDLGDNQGAQSHQDMMNPKHLVQTILSCEHRKLGQKTIEGVLCEGLETTDPAFLGPVPEAINRLEVQLRLWVNAETEYPVLCESKMSCEADGEVMSSEYVVDQFQWDVELDPKLFEPNIPAEYESM